MGFCRGPAFAPVERALLVLARTNVGGQALLPCSLDRVLAQPNTAITHRTTLPRAGQRPRTPGRRWSRSGGGQRGGQTAAIASLREKRLPASHSHSPTTRKHPTHR
ncbi:hypothetical protein BC830DRAFT_292512 [Chytriomyces sp. MP71]|nr:hypothetical protein BC830DRAFT_292512 [Chytriomyces sp. MP71]